MPTLSGGQSCYYQSVSAILDNAYVPAPAFICSVFPSDLAQRNRRVSTGKRQSGDTCIVPSASSMDEGEHPRIYNVLEVGSRSDRSKF